MKNTCTCNKTSLTEDLCGPPISNGWACTVCLPCHLVAPGGPGQSLAIPLSATFTVEPRHSHIIYDLKNEGKHYICSILEILFLPLLLYDGHFGVVVKSRGV